jgi:hypothetical protein
MLKEFVESIAKLVAAGVRPVELADLSDRRKIVLAMPNGTVVEKKIEPPDRVCHVRSVGELARFAADHCSVGGFPGAIFFNETTVAFLQPTDGGEDVAVCQLALSDAWQLLQKLDEPNGGALLQKDFIRAGRFVLRMSPAVIEPFRRIDFTQTNSGFSDVRKGNENLGKSLVAQAMTGGVPIPDCLDVCVPIFDTPGEIESYMIRLDVELSTLDQRIVLKPCPDELNRAMAAHLETMRERIESGLGDSLEYCDVYHASPWEARK